MKKVTFEIPDGYVVPEGIADGDTFTASVTMKLEDNGKRLCLTEVDGIPMPGYEDDAAKGRKANEGASAAQSDLASRYATAMEGAPVA
jgi:hypothetical protein